jgi:hypothetical protein
MAKTIQELLMYQLQSKYMTDEKRAEIEALSSDEEKFQVAQAWNKEKKEEEKAEAGQVTGNCGVFSASWPKECLPNEKYSFEPYCHIDAAFERITIPGFKESVVIPGRWVNIIKTANPVLNEKSLLSLKESGMGFLKNTIDLNNVLLEVNKIVAEANYKLMDFLNPLIDVNSTLFEAQEKVDGSNHRIIVDPRTESIYPGGRTHKSSDSFAFSEFFKQLSYSQLEEALSWFFSMDEPITLFVEFYGKGIGPAGGKYDSKNHHACLFDVRVGNDTTAGDELYSGYSSFQKVKEIYNKLIEAGVKDLDLVKSYGQMTPQEAVDLVRLGFRSKYFWKDGENIADDPTKWGKDENNRPTLVEGLVLKHIDQMGLLHVVKVKTVHFKDFDRAWESGKIQKAVEEGKLTLPEDFSTVYPPLEVLKEKYKNYSKVTFI